jgi:hypothetical protein
MTDELASTQDKACAFANDVTVFDAGGSDVDLFFCTMGGVPIEFMGGYPVDTGEKG